MSYVHLQAISKAFHSRTLFSDLDLDIQAGDRLALIGENGAGKTTLFKIISGQETVDTGTVTRASHLRIGHLQQQIERQNSELTALEASSGFKAEQKYQQALAQLAEAVKAEANAESENPNDPNRIDLQQYQQALNEFEAGGGYEFAAKWYQTINALGLPQEIANRPLSQCSGGERMRLALAQILLDNPDLLLLDEPTNHLDLPAIEWLLNYLKSFKGSLLVISHDRYFLDQIATKCLFLEQESLRSFSGSYTQAKALKEEEDRFLLSKRKEFEKELAHQQEVTQTFLSHRNISGYHSRQKIVKKLSEELAKLKEQQSKGPSKMSFHFTAPKDLGDPNRIVLAAQDLSKVFPDRELFTNLKLNIKAHDKIILLGTNGSGKSSLIKILSGQDRDFSGQIKGNQNLSIATMAQTVLFADETATCLTTLMNETDLGEPEARNLLARFGFKEIDVYKRVSVLSGGERSRLYMCSILEQHPSLLFLDEPTNHLDIYSREILEKAISQYDGAVLAITHDRYFASQFANRYLVLEDNKLNEYNHLQEAIRTQLQARLKNPTNTPAKESTPKEKPSPLSSDSKTSSSPSNISPSLRRKQIARLQTKIKEIEKLLQNGEEELAKLNLETTPLSSPDHYQRIADLSQNIASWEDEFLNYSLQLEEIQSN